MCIPIDDRLDFVIAGAQKGGTTHLVSHLTRIDGVWMSGQEDLAFESPHYESGDVDRLRAEIASLRDDVKAVGIKRASYLGFDNVPGRIKTEFPDCKTILVLRDPVDRAVSSYFHKAQYGQVKLMPVSEAFAAILDGDDLGNPRTLETLSWSKYSELVPRWEETFGEALIVVGNGDLRKSPSNVLKRVTEHIGIADQGTAPVPSESNVGATSMAEIRFRRRMHRAITAFDPVTHQLGARTNNPLRLAYGGVMREAGRLVHRRRPTKPDSMKLSNEMRARLTEHFAEDYEYVEANFGIGL